MRELWREVVGWPYIVSSEGRIRRLTPAPGTWPGRYIKTHLNAKIGYQQVILHREAQAKTFRVHRLVCEAFHGPPPEGHEVRHLNGDRLDNRRENLAWGTRKENAADSVFHAKGRKIIKNLQS